MGRRRRLSVRPLVGRRIQPRRASSPAPGKRAVDWNAARIRATADHQFGRGAADALLLGTVSYVVSKNTGKVRNVMVYGDHVLSLRAEDGLFTLKAAGAQRLH